jgi:DNA repair protein RadC
VALGASALSSAELLAVLVGAGPSGGEAIAERAAAVILVHNHPSGDPTPSTDDRLVTEQLVAAGKLLDIPVHDHVIIGRGRYTSFAEAGLL